MTLNEYQKAANSTAIFPKNMAVPYTLLGLNEQAVPLAVDGYECSWVVAETPVKP